LKTQIFLNPIDAGKLKNNQNGDSEPSTNLHRYGEEMEDGMYR
jgi:hypothetical protein